MPRTTKSAMPQRGNSSMRAVQGATRAHRDRRPADVLHFPDLAAESIVHSLSQVLSTRRSALGLKRGLDAVIAALALIALGPLLLVIAAWVRLDSRGPAIFRQHRIGLKGTVFTLYKFRSMRVEQQDLTGVQHTTRNDPRVTKIGRFLRKYSLDELPQLYNVLRGDMSIVGPRAHAIGMQVMGVPYTTYIREYSARHVMRPGITGLAQVRGFRGEVADEAHARGRINSDLEYIRRFSVWLDIKIMLMTIPAVVSGRAAF